MSEKGFMFSDHQKITHYLLVVLLVFLSGTSFAQKKKHRKKLTTYDSLFMESSYPENRKLLLGTWKYVNTESPNGDRELYSNNDSSRLYIKHNDLFSTRNFFVVHYAGTDSIVRYLYSGLADSIPDSNAMKRIEEAVKTFHRSHVKYLPTIADNISKKNHIVYFPSEKIQIVKLSEDIKRDSIRNSFSYTFTMSEVIIKRDSAGYINEASYPYMAVRKPDSGNNRILIVVSIGKESLEVDTLNEMYFYVHEINNQKMRIIPGYIGEGYLVNYKKE